MYKQSRPYFLHWLIDFHPGIPEGRYRDDLHLKESQKQDIIKTCEDGQISKLGSFQVVNTETIDGFKYYLENGAWVLIRPSGTEPVLRVYCQASNMTEVRTVLDAAKETLLKI